MRTEADLRIEAEVIKRRIGRQLVAIRNHAEEVESQIHRHPALTSLKTRALANLCIEIHETASDLVSIQKVLDSD